MTEQSREPVTITSHPLCPFMHSWRMALAAAGRVAGKDDEVRRLEYRDASRWAASIPPGADIPWLTTGEDTLWGTLPVLQWIHETLPAAGLLSDDATERVRARNRALLAVELLSTMRTVFASKSPAEEHATTTALFAALARADAQPWSPRGRLDWLLLAAAATILASRSKIMSDARWSSAPTLKARVLELSTTDIVLATRIGAYDDEFQAFYRAFGGTFESSHGGA